VVNTGEDPSGLSPVAARGTDTALEEWLQSEQLPLAEQVDRLAADSALYADLRRQGFTGQDYQYVETVLARYGHAIIAGWLTRRTIEAKCREKKLRHVPNLEEVDLGISDVDEIADETVAEALFYFRDRVLIPGKWEPRRGASLRTFFIGQCLIRFVGVMNRWLTEQGRDVLGDDTDIRTHEEAAVTDVENDVIHTLAAERALQHVTREDARVALTMQSRGYSLREIAIGLGRTEKAVESMIAYAKKQIRHKIGGKGSA
jgi:DNA-directed RNA polymerase specialized sigma24 family protein